MSGYAINFDDHAWEVISPGMRQKSFMLGGNRMRLIELTEELAEIEWCLKAHIGYVLEGQVNMEFEKKTVIVKAGEGLYMSGGEKSKHRSSVDKGGFARLLLFETG